MKLCFVNGKGARTNDRLCGPDRLAFELMNRLKSDYEVSSVRFGRVRRIKKQEKIDEFVVGEGVASFLRLFSTIKRIDPDIIHGHGSLNMGMLILALKIVLRKNGVLTFTDFKKNITSNYEWLNRLDGIIVQTEYAKDVLLRNGVNAKKIQVVTYGIENAFYHAKMNRQVRGLGKKLLLYYGDARSERGFDLLLRAAPYISREITLLLCIREFYKDYRTRLPKNVVILTIKDYPCPIQDIIKSCDMVILPFMKNTLEPPLTIMEASAVGTPLITTDIGGNKEVAARGTVLIRDMDAQKIGESINYYMKTKKKVDKKIYSWEKTKSNIEIVYKKILS